MRLVGGLRALARTKEGPRGAPCFRLTLKGYVLVVVSSCSRRDALLELSTLRGARRLNRVDVDS